MASLKKNGTEIGRISTLASEHSYRSNGKVLINRGAGWKVRDTFTPAEVAKVYAQELDDYNGRHLMLEAFEQVFLETFPRKDQYTAFALFQHMSHDGDALADLLQGAGIDVTYEDANILVAAWAAYRHAVGNSPHKVYYTIGQETHIVTICGTREEAKPKARWAREHLHSQGHAHRVMIAPAKPSELRMYSAAGNRIG